MILMTKEIEINADNIRKAKDKRYVFDTYENIIDSIFDFDCVSNLTFEKDNNSFHIKFDLVVCKSGDLLWVLIKEFLSCIKQTEEQVQLQIDEVEPDGIGMTYRLLKYTPCYHPIEKER